MPSGVSKSSGSLFPASPKSAALSYTAHIDGGARGNPGPAGYGVVIHDPAGRKIAELSEYLGHHTNNYAEYQGLLAALRYAQENGIKAIKLISDSELMVRQMKGIYKVKHPELRKLHGEAQPLVRKLEYFEIRHALREDNQDADRLANEAMDRGRSAAGKSAIDKSAIDKSAVEKIAPRAPVPKPAAREEFEGIVRNGVVEFVDGAVPDGTRVQIRVRR